MNVWKLCDVAQKGKTQRKYVTHLLNESDPISAAYIAFRAGMISGKRIERARRARNHD